MSRAAMRHAIVSAKAKFIPARYHRSYMPPVVVYVECQREEPYLVGVFVDESQA